MSDQSNPVLARTPPQILGPFYPIARQPELGGDLTQHAGGKASGTVLYLSGRVTTAAGAPVADAQIEIWQANARGRYDHPGDENPAPLDPHFAGYGLLRTDAEGRYAAKTIRPIAYPVAPGVIRPAHIHFMVTSRTERLVTQMYFAGDAYNDIDPYLGSARRKDALIVSPVPAGRADEPEAEMAEFNIVIGG